MRTVFTSTVALALLASAPASADKLLDMSSIECRQFKDYDKDNTALIMTWLEAYYLDEDADPILNFTKMTSDTTKLLQFCAANPTAGLITAAEKVMGKSKGKSEDQ